MTLSQLMSYCTVLAATGLVVSLPFASVLAAPPPVQQNVINTPDSTTQNKRQSPKVPEAILKHDFFGVSLATPPELVASILIAAGFESAQRGVPKINHYQQKYIRNHSGIAIETLVYSDITSPISRKNKNAGMRHSRTIEYIRKVTPPPTTPGKLMPQLSWRDNSDANWFVPLFEIACDFYSELIHRYPACSTAMSEQILNTPGGSGLLFQLAPFKTHVKIFKHENLPASD